MIPENRDDLYVLAGEYVLGVIDRDGAQEVVAALATHAELRRAVTFWEERLHGLSALAPPDAPPAGLWDEIASRLDPTQATPHLWESLRLWRWSTAVATAVAACLAFYIALTPPAAGPSFVAVLHAPQQEQPAWVAAASGNGLLIRAVAGGAPPRDRSFELWAIASGPAKPEPLGVIPPNGRLELGALPAAIRSGSTLAISIEPKGGSPTGQPTGPVVFTGILVAAK